MRVKTEYLVLTAIIVAATAYLIYHKGNRQHYTLPKLPAVSADEITRIDITHKNHTISLAREGDLWRITPGGYPADSASVNGMLSAISDLSLTAMVSESKAYARYDLSEDKRIQVTAYAGDRLVRSMDVGKAAPTFQHTFVKLPDDDRVYHGAGDFRRKFDRSVDDLRDKVVMSFAPEKINAITVTTLEDAYALERKPAATEKAAPPAKADDSAKKAGWITTDGKEMAGSDVDPLLSRLNRLACTRFFDDLKPEDLGTPEMTVTLGGGEKPLTLEIFPERDGIAEGQPAVSSENAQPFLLSKWQVESLEEIVGKWGGKKEKTDTPAQE